MRRIILSVIATISPGLSAVLGALVPVSPTVDFGRLNEAEGQKTVRTHLVNKGDTTLYISRVRTTCGCTAARYYDDAIAPGDSAWLDITYDPRGRLGEFEKTVRVYTTTGEIVPIKIHGDILNTEETIARRYPHRAGPLRLSETKILSGRLGRGETRTLYISFYNMADHEVRPQVVASDEAINVEVGPMPVPARSIGTLGIFPNVKKNLPPGQHRLEITLVPDSEDPSSEEVTLEVFIEIE